MKEWTTEFNPFNSWKVLMAKNWLEGIASGNLLPPLTCDTDLTNTCQLNCVWCNSQLYRKECPGMLSKEHIFKLADFYAEWGINSTCIAGGGESLLHPNVDEFIYRLFNNGLEIGVITNGVYMLPEAQEAISDCVRYVGISLDAGTPESYSKVKRVPPKLFDTVINNISSLAKLMRKKESKKLKSHDLTIKFLIHPDNCSTIFEATKLAKNLGCYAIHIRPVGLANLRNEDQKGINFNFDLSPFQDIINEQLEKCFALEDSTFRVFAPRVQKFGENLGKVVKFKKCHASPLHAVFGADGWVHICFNLRGYPNSRLVKHFPDPQEVKKIWGTEQHKQLLEKIDPFNTCPRCTFTHYNLVLENMILEDKCYWKFI